MTLIRITVDADLQQHRFYFSESSDGEKQQNGKPIVRLEEICSKCVPLLFLYNVLNTDRTKLQKLH